MGKKNKKLNKILDSQVPLDNLIKSETEEINSETISCSISTNSVKKSKRKNLKRDCHVTITDEAPEQTQSEEIIEGSAPADHSTAKIKKKKRKEQPEIKNDEADEEDQSHKINEAELSVPKKKKKKTQGDVLDQEEKHQLDQDNGNNEIKKSSKKKKNKEKSLTELDSKPEIPKKEIGEVAKKKKKSRNKAKTGAPVLNDEEAQVTQEDIDKFCDEIDDEDNKQYEDWVKLLDARLGKNQIKTE